VGGNGAWSFFFFVGVGGQTFISAGGKGDCVHAFSFEAVSRMAEVFNCLSLWLSKHAAQDAFGFEKGLYRPVLKMNSFFFSVLETKSENGNIFAMFLIFDFFFLKNKKQNKTKKIKSDTVKMRENPKSSIYQAFFPKGKRGQG